MKRHGFVAAANMRHIFKPKVPALGGIKGTVGEV